MLSKVFNTVSFFSTMWHRSQLTNHHRCYLEFARTPLLSFKHYQPSTSDDSSQYRSIEEVEEFARNSDPLDRLQKFFERHDYDEVTGETIQSMIEEEKSAILDALRTAERKPKPPLDDLFTDVYKDMPPSLQNQREQLMEHVSKYPDSYKL
mmetsp:Transcript_34960/g.73345  ORF Transcript_34960/g.73345 Transcript_34960/m.73345 type:complete len:151 (+) Transcript_34960:1629-2081(+)